MLVTSSGGISPRLTRSNTRSQRANVWGSESSSVNSSLEKPPSSAPSAWQSLQYFAKKVRSGTAIGRNPVSVAYAAVALAQRLFSDLASEYNNEIRLWLEELKEIDENESKQR